MNGISGILFRRIFRHILLDIAVKVLLLLMIVGIPAAIQGRFVPNGSYALQVGCDLFRLSPLFEQPNCRQPIVFSPLLSTSFTLFRDYASLFHIIMIAVMSTLGGNLIRSLSRFWLGLARRGMIGQLSRRQRRTHILGKKVLASYPLQFAVLLISFAACYVGVLGYEGNGIYPALSPGPNQVAFAKLAVANSWSAFPGPGFWAFLVVGTIGNFIILWVGCCAGVSLWIAQSLVKDNKLLVDPDNMDHSWGWEHAFEAARYGNYTMVAGVVGLVFLLLRGGYTSIPYLVIFPLIAVFAAVPFALANGVWLDAIKNTRSVLSRGNFDGTPDAYMRRYQALSLNSAPTRIVSLNQLTFQLAFTVAPGILALMGLVYVKS